MTNQSIDLAQLFGSVVSTLDQHKAALNQADTYNHNHGDNMVEIFEVITQAMKAKSNATPAEQLAYASQLLQAKSQSSSAKLYAQGLQDASAQLGGKKTLTTNNALTLLQALMGTQKKVTPQTLQTQARKTFEQQPSGQSAGGDLLGSLLGGLAGAQQTPSGAGAGGDLLGSLLGGLAGAQQAPAGAGTGDDLLSSLLGGLTGAAAPSGSKPVKIDTAQLLKAGMAYMQAKQSGSSDINALLSALMAGSRMGTQNYRTQSGTLVANSLLKALAQMGQ
ncbi:MAG TPA: DAK2 domain-containing protein [Anaerolineaceae bacterium]|nr:DAK2 domain-containing protein [Anaerolineaceae bacterium]HUM64089.1 DAK2 domain-containing protein [Anaerolineaceae bacterium]